MEAETRFERSVLSSVMARLPEHQPTFARTGGLHAAALATQTGEILLAREDVNQADKAAILATNAKRFYGIN